MCMKDLQKEVSKREGIHCMSPDSQTMINKNIWSDETKIEFFALIIGYMCKENQG